jgi:hypothetical protein
MIDSDKCHVVANILKEISHGVPCLMNSDASSTASICVSPRSFGSQEMNAMPNVGCKYSTYD